MGVFRLEFARPLVSPNVVDLGCGTGVGYQLLREINPSVRYLGVDLSKAMVRLSEIPDENLILGDMDDLSALDNGSVDVVLLLFTSMSFTFCTGEVLADVARVLRPGGHAYLSVLTSTSPSLITRRAVREGVYRTRGDDHAGPGAPIRLFRVGDVKRLVSDAGLTLLSIVGMNAMSGSLSSHRCSVWADSLRGSSRRSRTPSNSTFGSLVDDVLVSGRAQSARSQAPVCPEHALSLVSLRDAGDAGFELA